MVWQTQFLSHTLQIWIDFSFIFWNAEIFMMKSQKISDLEKISVSSVHILRSPWLVKKGNLGK